MNIFEQIVEATVAADEQRCVALAREVLDGGTDPLQAVLLGRLDGDLVESDDRPRHARSDQRVMAVRVDLAHGRSSHSPMGRVGHELHKAPRQRLAVQGDLSVDVGHRWEIRAVAAAG